MPDTVTGTKPNQTEPMTTFTKPKPKPKPTVDLVHMSSLTRKEQLYLDNAVSPYGQPEKVFNRKVEALASLLNCTEAEATHILLHNL
jgi:hypothetical protein